MVGHSVGTEHQPDSTEQHLEANSGELSGKSAAGDVNAGDRAPLIVDQLPHQPKHRRQTRRPWVWVAAAVVVLMAAVGGTLLALMKTVTVTVDGDGRSVSTLAGTVAGALAAADISVGDHDTMAPAADSALRDGSTISINRGRLLTLTLDGQQVQLWTTARTVEEALAEIGRDPADLQLSADRSRAIPLDGLSISGATLYDVTLVNGTSTSAVSVPATTVRALLQSQGIVLAPNQAVSPGLDTSIGSATRVVVSTLPTVLLTDGTDPPRSVIATVSTVSGLLTKAGVVLNPSDTVSAALDAPLTDGMAVSITRVGSSEISQIEPIAQPADETVPASDLSTGTTRVSQQGRSGEATVVYQVVMTNGVETARTEVSRTVTTEALPTVTRVGTKVSPTSATSTPSTSATSQSTPTTEQAVPDEVPAAASTTSSSSGSVERVGNQVFFHDFEYGINWDGIATCESTNNPSAVNANPSAGLPTYGLFQFDLPTWRSVGGSGNPADAAPEEQLMRAKLLYQQRGLEPWVCGYAG